MQIAAYILSCPERERTLKQTIANLQNTDTTCSSGEYGGETGSTRGSVESIDLSSKFQHESSSEELFFSPLRSVD